MFENRTLVNLLQFNQVVQAQTNKALSWGSRQAGQSSESGNRKHLNTNTCSIDAAKVWNKASEKIRTAKTLAFGNGQKGNQSTLQNFTHLEMLKIVGERC